jgi:mono/diheme cytochrome c family protein
MTRIANDAKAAGRLSRRLCLFLILSCAAAVFAVGSVRAQAPQFTPRDEAPENFPAGAGRDETFYSCTACHNFKLVAAQGLSRRQWDESIALMVQKHNMPALDDKDKKIVLDYLETAFPARAPSSGGWQNPFLKQ